MVLVDNGCTTDDVEVLEQVPGVDGRAAGHNLGFAGGCNAGAAAATGELPRARQRRRDRRADHRRPPRRGGRRGPASAIAGASIRLASDPHLINSAGNPVHLLGTELGRDGSTSRKTRTQPEEVAVASGACLLTALAVWRRLGGFDEEYFAYHEDTELSIRIWQSGGRVVYVPDASPCTATSSPATPPSTT